MFFIIFGRMTKLLDEELEEDELFWNQEALKEVVQLVISHILLLLLTDVQIEAYAFVNCLMVSFVYSTV